MRKIDVDCCVVGGGPAGIMAGLLFARAGCRTVVLEKHGDFLRDFRGDTVHPSTLENLRELGLLKSFLERPHQKLSKLAGVFGGKRLDITDFSSLKTPNRYIVFMPQWHFLDFLCDAARKLPTFSIEMKSEVEELVITDGRVTGVRAQTLEGPLEISARLTIGADGRNSVIRERANLPVEELGAPIDVLWFMVPKTTHEPDEPLLNTGPGHIVITIDRDDYYQCALVIPKGGAQSVFAEGLHHFRKSVAATAPKLAGQIDAVKSLDEVKLLTVRVDRLKEWSRPGLLMIGDSAHAMSPIGGVGINLAIQDAVAAANLLASALANERLSDDMLEQVQKRRLWPVRVTQFAQIQAQNRIIKPLLSEKGAPAKAPLPLRLVAAIPWLQRKMAHWVGIGVQAEHIRSPAKFPVTH